MGNQHPRPKPPSTAEGIIEEFALLDDNPQVLQTSQVDTVAEALDGSIFIIVHSFELLQLENYVLEVSVREGHKIIASTTLPSSRGRKVVVDKQLQFFVKFNPEYKIHFGIKTGSASTLTSREYQCLVPLTAAHEFQYGGVRSTEILEVTKGSAESYSGHGISFYATSVKPTITFTLSVSKKGEVGASSQPLDSPESAQNSPTPYIDTESSEVALKLQLLNSRIPGTYILSPASGKESTLLCWVLTESKDVVAHAIHFDPTTSLYTFQPSRQKPTSFYSLYSLLMHHFKNPLTSHGPPASTLRAVSGAGAAAAAAPGQVLRTSSNPLRTSGRTQLKTSGGALPPPKVHITAVDAAQMDIFHAARVGDMSAVRKHIRTNKVNVNSVDEYGNTAIYYSVLCGHIDVVAFLFDNGAEVDLSTPDGNRMLLASMTNNIREILKKRGKFSNTSDHQEILRKSFSGSFEHVQRLCQLVNVNYTSKDGLKAVDCAALAGHEKILTLLREKGAYGTLTSDFALYVNNPQFADIIFITTDGKEVYAHKVFLLNRVKPWVWALILGLDDASTAILKLSTAGNTIGAGDIAKITLSQRCTLGDSVSLLTFLKHVYYGAYLIPSQSVWGKLATVSKCAGVHECLPLLSNVLAVPLDKFTFSKLELDPGLASAMDLAFNCQDYSDVVLVVEGREIYAHRVVLCARSAYFQAMLGGKLREAEVARIVMEDLHYDTIYTMLEFLYSNRLKHPDLFTVQEALEMLSSASMWLLAGLRDYCEEILTTQGNVEIGEAVDIYLYAYSCDAPRFMKMILKEMKTNPRLISKHPKASQLPQDVIDELGLDQLVR